MRKVLFAINVTADGCCSHTDMIPDEGVHSYFTQLLRNAGVLLYGRVTYELMVPFWPDAAKSQSMAPASNEFARVFDSIPKVLFSRTLNSVDDANTRLAGNSLEEEVTGLKKQPGRDICVGSLSLASQLSEIGLIDEYQFVVHPVVAGKGPRLFETAQLKERFLLDFLGSETFPSGTVALRYGRRA